jgi:hypothetical protein
MPFIFQKSPCFFDGIVFASVTSQTRRVNKERAAPQRQTNLDSLTRTKNEK